ncbi:DsrH/TusB family sulfur relay protein [Conservatibacter flavescens]|uniref:Sulfurtransferase complex subunit TusB n=1 Tax=Conservatibacter flavescens TaxID=28161 RepID=A0A2M8S002_9PAST|nr:DsrH/TusB family sulfur metabolism protein [Conservatibacter flavescens]PJG84469.1 hypothetical protein CVP05_11160 [Conservatibacter flavescens]
MLYTFSRSDYSLDELERYLANAGINDAIVLWQNGVLLALKYPNLFEGCFALQQDIEARGLQAMNLKVQLISLTDLVGLTERYFPQLAL